MLNENRFLGIFLGHGKRPITFNVRNTKLIQTKSKKGKFWGGDCWKIDVRGKTSARAVSIVVANSSQSTCEKATKSRGYVQISFDIGQPWLNVKVLSGAGKRKVSDAVTTERTSTVRKHSRKFSPGAKCQNHLIATKSSRKSLFAVDENEHASNEDTTPTVPLFMNTFENTFLLILTCEIEECKSRNTPQMHTPCSGAPESW
jgi:hypothetical protein